WVSKSDAGRNAPAGGAGAAWAWHRLDPGRQLPATLHCRRLTSPAPCVLSVTVQDVRGIDTEGCPVVNHQAALPVCPTDWYVEPPRHPTGWNSTSRHVSAAGEQAGLTRARACPTSRSS